MPSQWGEFQSLIQISIALNGGYFTLAQFGEPTARREKRLIKNTQNDVRDMIKMGTLTLSKGTPSKGRTFLLSCIEIEEKINELEANERVCFRFLRYTSTVMFGFGIIMLIYSSFYASREVQVLGKTLCVVLSMPVTVGLITVGLINPLRYRGISRRRREIDEKLQMLDIKKLDPLSAAPSDEAAHSTIAP